MFKCFTKNRCTACGYFCHKFRDTGILVKNDKADELMKLLEYHEYLDVHPYQIVVTKQEPYASDYKHDAKIHSTRFLVHPKHDGQSPIAVRYDAVPQQIQRTQKRTVKVHTGSRFVDEEVPVYKTVTGTTTETYQEKVVTKKEPIHRERIVRTNHGAYNTWSHQWEPRWYEERFPETEIFNDKIEYVNKTREVPYTKQVQTGTKTVRREIPTFEEKTVNQVYMSDESMVTQHYYYLVPIGNNCGNCKCSSCFSIWSTLHQKIHALFVCWM